MNDSGYVKKELREAIKKYAKDNKWHASSAAVSMVTGKTKMIAFVVNKLSNYINSIILEEVVVNLRVRGFHVLVSQFDSPEEQQIEMEAYIYRRPDAVIVFPLVLSKAVDDILDQLLANGTRVIVMGARQTEHCASVTFDHYLQGFKQMEYLIEHGHRKIAFIGGFAGELPEMLLNADEGNKMLPVQRLKGSIDASEAAGINFNLKTDVIDYHDKGKLLKEALVARRHTAYICSETEILCSFYRLCAELNIKIKDDVSVIGFGKNPLWEGFIPFPVCLNPEAALLGKTVVSLITVNEFKIEKIKISPTIISGNSVKKYNGRLS